MNVSQELASYWWRRCKDTERERDVSLWLYAERTYYVMLMDGYTYEWFEEVVPQVKEGA